ncbi:MAG: hypothetical protein AAFR33_03340, partial [Pseudomonadota bacterium]
MLVTQPKRISIMGATGSIGRSAADVVLHANAESPDPVFEIEALVAGSNVDELVSLARVLKPSIAVIADETAGEALAEGLADFGIESAAGELAAIEARPAEPEIAASSVSQGRVAASIAASSPAADSMPKSASP